MLLPHAKKNKTIILIKFNVFLIQSFKKKSLFSGKEKGFK